MIKDDERVKAWAAYDKACVDSVRVEEDHFATCGATGCDAMHLARRAAVEAHAKASAMGPRPGKEVR